MAHVLLPCDLPYWPDVLKLLSQLRARPDGLEMVRIMDLILDACCVSLDPDDSQRGFSREGPHPGLSQLGYFVDEVLCEEERTKLLEDTLPVLASRAADLKRLKPPDGMLYSLRREGGAFRLQRSFVTSLLANAFFSTFPKRNAKTHPTLQDFRMVHFFKHLNRRSHQRKLKAFLHYFEDVSADGEVVFTRKVVSGPSLPGWLCSDRPLVPLVVRPEGSLLDPPDMYRACFCPPLIGGDVLKESTSKEAALFFAFPELLVILSFVESLEDDEALTVEPGGQQGGPVGFCFLDAGASTEGGQYEDRALLRELNKALAAFLHEPRQKSVEVRRAAPAAAAAPEEDRPRRGSGGAVRRKNPSLGHNKKSVSQTSSKLSMRTASQSSVPATGKEEDFFTADDDSGEDGGSRLSDSMDLPRTEDISVSRSDSLGFVLGEGEGGSEDASLPQHERLDDFRKRIRKRTRRRPSRRSSYAGSSGSSDMEDISEDPEPPPEMGAASRGGMRPANSEPTIASLRYDGCGAPFSEAAEIALRSGRRMMVTASNGHLKAYSYDGVSPNLPVPFRARFRRRRPQLSPTSSLEDNSASAASAPKEDQEEVLRRRCVAVDGSECPGDSQLGVTVLWLAASMADLPALVLYTAGQPSLREVCSVYRQVLSRDWTVGDLSCEVLRFCRNRLQQLQHSNKRKSHSKLFGQLIGNTPQTTQDYSLDLD